LNSTRNLLSLLLSRKSASTQNKSPCIYVKSKSGSVIAQPLAVHQLLSIEQIEIAEIFEIVEIAALVEIANSTFKRNASKRCLYPVVHFVLEDVEFQSYMP